MDTKHFQGPGFSLQVPTDWFISSSPQLQVIFFAPPEADGFRANLAIAMRLLQGDVALNAVATEARRIQEAEYPEYQVIREFDFTEQGGIAIQRVYRWWDETAGRPLLQMQTFVLAGQVLFTLTATRIARDGAPGEALDAIFNQMVNSFRIEIPPESEALTDQA